MSHCVVVRYFTGWKIAETMTISAEAADLPLFFPLLNCLAARFVVGIYLGLGTEQHVSEHLDIQVSKELWNILKNG